MDEVGRRVTQCLTNLRVLACVAQVSVVVPFNNSLLDINHALHLYYKCYMWIEFLSI